MKNHNKLLTQIDGATGIKTGYTIKSGRCLVSSVLRSGQEIIVVTLSDPDDWRDHKSLYDAAFDDYPMTEFVTKGEFVAKIPVVGTEGQMAEFYTAESLSFGLSEEEKDRVELVVYLPKFMYASQCENGGMNPVYGKVTAELDGAVIKTVELAYQSATTIE